MCVQECCCRNIHAVVTADFTAYAIDQGGALKAGSAYLAKEGISVRSFASIGDFLWQYELGSPGCVILNTCNSGLCGLVVVDRLAMRGISLPVLIARNRSSECACDRSSEMGVFALLDHPVDEHLLLDSVRRALAYNAERRVMTSVVTHGSSPRLTSREAEVFQSLVAGKSLKQIASRSKVTVQSVWKHQQRILAKFGVSNEVELVHRVRGVRVPGLVASFSHPQ